MDFLPEKIILAIQKLDLNKLYNMRLRINQPIILNYGFEKSFLSPNGVAKNKVDSIICDSEDIFYIVDRVTKRSIYAFNERIKCGFINAEGGVRIGLSGECVFDKNGIVTIKNFDSLNIRIPHKIEGCAKNVFKLFESKFNKSILIVSPPFCGKTTILKDLAEQINSKSEKNILIIDERGEFDSIKGENIDCIKFSDKLFAFEYGIRVMSPDIVITDELCSASDWNCAKKVVDSGVNIIASCHSSSFEDLKSKDYFIPNIFDKYVILAKGKIAGIIDSVYDKNGEKL